MENKKPDQQLIRFFLFSIFHKYTQRNRFALKKQKQESYLFIYLLANDNRNSRKQPLFADIGVATKGN